MRPIKFRLWNGVIMYHFNLGDEVIVGDKPVMQFTGLFDKSGREIWEGDIVQSSHIFPSKIEFHDGSFCFNSDDPFPIHFSIYENDDIEVIGNIYENPEVLELKKEGGENYDRDRRNDH